MVPVIHSLVFVHASHQKIVDFKHNYYKYSKRDAIN